MAFTVAKAIRLNKVLILIDLASQAYASSQAMVDVGALTTSIACDSAVNLGDPVYLDSNSKIFQALANNSTTVNFIGIATIKNTQTMCQVQMGLKTPNIYSNLVTNDDYFVGVTGGLVSTIPGSGTYTLRAGTAYSSQALVIYKGVPTKRS